MDKIDIISKLRKEKIVAVIRTESKEKCEKIVDSIVQGGINFIEITMTMPGAIDIIKELSEKYKANSEVIIGAGTVLDSETARTVILAGAKYVVSPSLNKETVKMCNRYRVPIMPGVMTVKEAIEALELGVDVLKIFPGNVFGASIIKTFKGPLPQANFMPTGGVTLENAKDWINNGAIAIGTGNSLTEFAKREEFMEMTQKARKFVNTVRKCL